MELNVKRFNRIEITEQSIQRTRKWFSENELACIEEVKNGNVHVNNNEAYFAWRKQQAEEYMEGKHDCTIAFLQRAYYLQTGKDVALLP